MLESTQLVPVEHEMQVYQVMAKQAVESNFYRKFGDTAAVMSIMMSARELGISPMAALNGGLNIIQGKVEISARMMNALIRRAGHSVTTKTCTPEKCELEGKRSDTQDKDCASFTIEEAKAAGLVKPGGGWQKYPSDMLYARTLSRLARRLFPDVVGCCYVEGEIQAVKQDKGRSESSIEVEVVESVDKSELAAVFDKDVDLPLITEYVNLVNKKFGKSYKEIFDKYKSDKKDFMEKFNRWKESRK